MSDISAMPADAGGTAQQVEQGHSAQGQNSQTSGQNSFEDPEINSGELEQLVSSSSAFGDRKKANKAPTQTAPEKPTAQDFEIEGQRFTQEQVLDFAKKHFNVNQGELRRSQQLFQQEQQLKQIISSLKGGNLEEAARQLGADPVDVATQILENHLRRLEQPKEVTELEKSRLENAKLQEQLQSHQKQQAQKQFELESNFHAEKAAHEFAEALRQVDGFVQGDPNAISRMAQLAMVCENSGRPYDANVLAAYVRNSMVKEHQALIGKMDDNQFENYLTVDGLKRAAKILLNKRQQLLSQNTSGANFKQNSEVKSQPKEYYSSPQELYASLRR